MDNRKMEEDSGSMIQPSEAQPTSKQSAHDFNDINKEVRMQKVKFNAETIDAS